MLTQNWQYAYTPAIWPSIFTIMLLTVLAVYAWRRRNLQGALPLAIVSMVDARHHRFDLLYPGVRLAWALGYTPLPRSADGLGVTLYQRFP